MTAHLPMIPYDSDALRWQAVITRDSEAAKAFVYGVVTTGIYCRPGCASRRPKRENVRFFETYQQAEAAGLRPCRRCMPRELQPPASHADAVVRACQLISEAESMPTLAQLARAVGLSPSHLHRLFKAQVGVTPKQYAMARRAERLRSGLESGASVTEALYDAGYGASSRLYEEIDDTLGMPPTAYRRGGSGQVIHYATAPCDLGWVLVATTARGLCAIELGGDPQELIEVLHERFPQGDLSADQSLLGPWLATVAAFVARPQQGLDLPLDIQGTAFQRRVWQALRAIPAGQTVTYGEIAQRIGQPTAARAVASACASNPLAVAVPCHRVIRADGGLGGYHWGLERKEQLLEREAEG